MRLGERNFMKKLVSGITLMLLLTSMLTLALNVQPVRSDYVWTETIYIQADGSIQPPAAPISSVDNVTYTLTDNITGYVPDYSSAIVIERDNIIMDGAGYTLQGTGTLNSIGMELTGRSNVTIKNMKITTFHYGIWLDLSSNNSVSGNTVAHNWHGITLWDSSSNSVSGNTVANNMRGTYLYMSSNNTIYHNNFINNTIQVNSSGGSTNFWDDICPSGGNYWSDYTGVDEKKGINQDEPGSDGLGDTPYVVGADQDHYPLMHQWRELLGDVNGDGTVDMQDISLLADAFLSYPGHPQWNLSADINNDNSVDMLDVSTAIDHFMQP